MQFVCHASSISSLRRRLPVRSTTRRRPPAGGTPHRKPGHLGGATATRRKSFIQQSSDLASFAVIPEIPATFVDSGEWANLSVLCYEIDARSDAGELVYLIPTPMAVPEHTPTRNSGCRLGDTSVPDHVDPLPHTGERRYGSDGHERECGVLRNQQYPREREHQRKPKLRAGDDLPHRVSPLRDETLAMRTLG